jgi:predicted oxidoreductase
VETEHVDVVVVGAGVAGVGAACRIRGQKAVDQIAKITGGSRAARSLAGLYGWSSHVGGDGLGVARRDGAQGDTLTGAPAVERRRSR